jgi:Protein of unknown function (DUF2911)
MPMKKLARCSTLLLAFAALVTLPARAQMGDMNMPAKPGDAKALPSPPAIAETKLDGKSITIHYNSPSLRGRVMIGEHDPYDKVWRTGANPATSFVTTADLMVGALKVPAGSYTLYTLPEPPGTPWLLILNKQTGQWGTEYKVDMDLGRTPMMAKTLDHSQEAMTITFENVHGHGAELHVRWAKVDEFVNVELAQ